MQGEDGLPNLDAVIAKDVASDACLADQLELQRLRTELQALLDYLKAS